ncbi:MAG: hypothetical protein HC897_06490 [Thermoanaerobaculia bacterium]|nr:hypothetical protein [Thermoanaerobaculia bacterium]
MAGAQRSQQVFTLGLNGKIYRSMDAGEHWSTVGRLPRLATSSNGGFLFTNPGRSKTLFASTFFEPIRHQPTYYGLFISTDGGRAWRMVLSDLLVTKMQFDPQDSRWVYARTTDGVLLRSANGGSSWVDVSPFGDHFFELDFFVDRADPRRIVATSATTLFTSDDRGDSWSSALLDLPAFGYFIPLGSASAGRWFGGFRSYEPSSNRRSMLRTTKARPGGLWVVAWRRSTLPASPLAQLRATVFMPSGLRGCSARRTKGRPGAGCARPASGPLPSTPPMVVTF